MHVNINQNDTKGNQDLGRFFIVPGSRARAKTISHYLQDVEIKTSSRGHDLYLGKIKNTDIDIGIVSTGMGCPSIDIIITELINVGAKLFIRIGTCGSVSMTVKKNEIVVANACVRDESTSKNYAPLEFPAIADRNLVLFLEKALLELNIPHHIGTIHTKDSLYAREYLKGPLAADSEKYMSRLEKLGVLASEMETSHLYILGSVYSVKCATICGVIGDKQDPFGLSPDKIEILENQTIKVVLLAIQQYINYSKKNLVLEY